MRAREGERALGERERRDRRDREREATSPFNPASPVAAAMQSILAESELVSATGLKGVVWRTAKRPNRTSDEKEDPRNGQDWHGQDGENDDVEARGVANGVNSELAGVDETADVVVSRCTQPTNLTTILGTHKCVTKQTPVWAWPFPTSPRNRPAHVPCMPGDAAEADSSSYP